MAGHSKWAQIKRQKAVVDARRGVVFTRLGREITVAARNGADPAGNFQLRTAIEKAKAAGMPSSNIERAIAKGSGQGGGEADQFEAIRYEGYGPGGVAVLVECFTDNRNRTAADLRLAFSKQGGNLGESGCVGYLFEQQGVVRLEPPLPSEDNLLEGLLTLEDQGGPPVLGYSLEGRARRCSAPSPTLRPFSTACGSWAGPCVTGNPAGCRPLPADSKATTICAAACACSTPLRSWMTCAASPPTWRRMRS